MIPYKFQSWHLSCGYNISVEPQFGTFPWTPSSKASLFIVLCEGYWLLVNSSQFRNIVGSFKDSAFAKLALSAPVLLYINLQLQTNPGHFCLLAVLTLYLSHFLECSDPHHFILIPFVHIPEAGFYPKSSHITSSVNYLDPQCKTK